MPMYKHCRIETTRNLQSMMIKSECVVLKDKSPCQDYISSDREDLPSLQSSLARHLRFLCVLCIPRFLAGHPVLYAGFLAGLVSVTIKLCFWIFISFCSEADRLCEKCTCHFDRREKSWFLFRFPARRSAFGTQAQSLRSFEMTKEGFHTV